MNQRNGHVCNPYTSSRPVHFQRSRSNNPHCQHTTRGRTFLVDTVRRMHGQTVIGSVHHGTLCTVCLPRSRGLGDMRNKCYALHSHHHAWPIQVRMTAAMQWLAK